MIKARDGADSWLLQGRDHTCEIVGLDLDIAVRDDDDIMLDARRHVDQIADLAVDAMERRVDGELDIACSRRAAQTLR